MTLQAKSGLRGQRLTLVLETHQAVISVRMKCNTQTSFTAENEVDARQGCQSGFRAFRAADLCALHSQQGQAGAEEAQTHGGDHQAAANLDVSFVTQRAEGHL